MRYTSRPENPARFPLLLWDGIDSGEELARLYGTLEKLQTNAQQAPASLEVSE